MMWRWYMPRPARTHIAFIPIFIHQGTWMINILIFMHFFTHFLFCNWIEINQVVISYLAAIDTDDRMMTVHGVDRRVAGTLFWSITDLVGNSWSPTIVTDCRSIVPRGNKNLPIHHNFLGDGNSFHDIGFQASNFERSFQMRIDVSAIHDILSAPENYSVQIWILKDQNVWKSVFFSFDIWYRFCILAFLCCRLRFIPYTKYPT